MAAAAASGGLGEALLEDREAAPGTAEPCRCAAAARAEASAASTEPKAEAQDAGDRSTVACFFLLGAASDVTFNGIVLSVAYLVQELGMNVLVLIGRAQFVGSGCTMLVLFAFAMRRPTSTFQGLTQQCRSLMRAMIYMLGLNAAMVLFAASGWRLRGDWLQVALLANGVATGLSQSLAGVLSGCMTKFGGQPTAASAQVSGVGFGVALPTAVQLLLMPLGVPVRIAAVVNYSLAFGVTVCGMVALVHFQATKTFIHINSSSLDEVTGREGLTAALAERLVWFMGKRLQQVALPSLGLAINFAAMVYCNLLSPRMPTHGALPPPELLPTLLIGATNACDFAGRLSALGVLHRSSEASGPGALLQGSLQRLPLVSLWLLVRLLAVAACLSYCMHGPLERAAGSNALAFGLYALGAVCGGTATVALTQYAQSICMRTSGLNMDTHSALPCPLAGQIMLLACILGSMLGTVIPFPRG